MPPDSAVALAIRANPLTGAMRWLLPAFVVCLQACASSAPGRTQRSDCERGGSHTFVSMPAAPGQADQMRSIADAAPVSEKPVSSRQRYEHWYVLDSLYTRLCRDDRGFAVEMWDFAVSPEVKLVDKKLLLALDREKSASLPSADNRRSFRPRRNGRILMP